MLGARRLRFAPLLVAARVGTVVGCERAPTPAPTPTSPPTTAVAPSTEPSTAPSTPAATPWTKTLSPTQRREHAELTAALRKGLPEDSADYAEALALVMIHKRGHLDAEGLKKAVVARGLPPHRAGDPYLLVTPPPPPSGQTYEPASMPNDWRGTWGEMAMPYLLGELTRPEYDALHHAAHPACKK